MAHRADVEDEIIVSNTPHANPADVLGFCARGGLEPAKKAKLMVRCVRAHRMLGGTNREDQVVRCNRCPRAALLFLLIRGCPDRTVVEYSPEVHECSSRGKVGIAASLSVTLGFEIPIG